RARDYRPPAQPGICVRSVSRGAERGGGAGLGWLENPSVSHPSCNIIRLPMWLPREKANTLPLLLERSSNPSNHGFSDRVERIRNMLHVTTIHSKRCSD